jgi:hypothetical protein
MTTESTPVVQDQTKPLAWLSIPATGSGRVSQSERDAKSWINNGLRVIPLYAQPGSNADFEVGYLREKLEQAGQRIRELEKADSERLSLYVDAKARVRKLEAQLLLSAD